MNAKEMLKKMYKVLISPSEAFAELEEKPVHSSLSFVLGYSMFCLIFLMILQVPTIFSTLILYDMGSTFQPVITFLIYISVVFILYVIIQLDIQGFNLIRRKIRKKDAIDKEKTKVLNLYSWSLLPYVMFITQIPFILIFGGHYNLFFLHWFVISLFIILSCWHSVLLYKGLNSLKSAKSSKIIFISYLAILISITILSLYIINWNNLSLTFLGYLYG